MRALGMLMTTLAQMAPIPAPSPEPKPVVGFTADASAFLYEEDAELESQPDPDSQPDVVCTATLAVVRDLASARETRYLRRSQGDDCGGVKALKGVKPAAGFDAFLKAHPLGLPAALPGPRGTTLVGLHRACVSLRLAGGTGTLVFSEQGECKDGLYGSLDLALQRPDGRRYRVGALSAGPAATYTYPSSAEVYWLPDESRAAVVALEQRRGGRGSGSTQTVRVVAFEPVRVSVLGAKAATVAATVEKLGGLFVSTGTAQDKHTETVVFAARGFEAAAARVARAIPGARVDALTWKADAELVVALADR